MNKPVKMIGNYFPLDRGITCHGTGIASGRQVLSFLHFFKNRMRIISLISYYDSIPQHFSAGSEELFILTLGIEVIGFLIRAVGR